MSVFVGMLYRTADVFYYAMVAGGWLAFFAASIDGVKSQHLEQIGGGALGGLLIAGFGWTVRYIVKGRS